MNHLFDVKERRGEVNGDLWVELFAGIDVDTEEEGWFVPCVKMSRGCFPMNPARPAVLVTSAGHGLNQCPHFQSLRQLGQVLCNMSLTNEETRPAPL